ncbi:ABC transporter ATP-binding protein [Nocardiopsis sp. N85]|uniref:ABC transporter ATP-binding protein n=1 Tax=Nocardiopsis sp. N85 TaxID=3029400 RepID=UPI00237F905B|nr:ABC transporter ATP-binding protein [Nocardiopsis sp. N85]MDE3722567.1 ABC transporter ATP-binding protein [Nocardiopsis sp. N85]
MREVYRTYGSGAGKVNALQGISVELAKGVFTAVMGPSGSGKSTFLHCAAGLDRPSSGRVWLGGVDLSDMSENRLTRLRRERVGFVFQSYNLLHALTVQDNITMPLRLNGTAVDRDWAERVVRQVGIEDRLHHRPAELSGGQQQRVAIARALITRPDLVLADEPTGALDSRTGARVLALLRDTVAALGQTVLMVTHDPVAASYAGNVLFLADGRLVDSLAAPTSAAVAERMSRLGEH